MRRQTPVPVTLTDTTVGGQARTIFVDKTTDALVVVDINGYDVAGRSEVPLGAGQVGTLLSWLLDNTVGPITSVLGGATEATTHDRWDTSAVGDAAWFGFPSKTMVAADGSEVVVELAEKRRVAAAVLASVSRLRARRAAADLPPEQHQQHRNP